MSANTLLTSVLTGGTNTHTTTSEEANVIPTDFVTSGIVGAMTLNTGSGGTGSFCVNADVSPDMGITLKAGQAYVQATPSSQNSQVLRARAAADYTAYTINANASGSTKYDWIYLSINATNANNPSADGSNVASFVTSRSSSNTSDTGSPPTYGLLLAVVTVVNAASSITNSNITDKRIQAVIGTANSALSSFLTAGTFNFIVSGLVISGDSYASTLNGSMTSGSVYIGGAPNSVAGFSGHAFTASKDTYVDILYSTTGVGSVVFTEVTNNAASPALATSSVRIGIVVTGSTTIASVGSINQGQVDKVLPIASSIPYAVTDSLGNLICPRDLNYRLLGYRQVLTSSNVATTSPTAITGLATTVIIPGNRKFRITAQGDLTSNTINTNNFLGIYDTSTAGTQLNFQSYAVPNAGTANSALQQSVTVVAYPSAFSVTTTKTYIAAFWNTAGTTGIVGGTTQAPSISVDLL